MFPDLKAPTFSAYLTPVVAAVLVSDGVTPTAPSPSLNILHIPVLTSGGDLAYKGFHVQNVNTYTQPPQGLAATIQGRRFLVSAELPRLASRH